MPKKSEARSIGAFVADQPYTAREIARGMHCGLGQVHRAVRARQLRAAKLNARGDLRILGSWALEYLETLAKQR